MAGRNLRRDRRATLCVEVETPPFSFLLLEGTVALGTHASDPAALSLWAGRLGARYLGPDQEQAMAARNGVPGDLVRMTIEHVAGAETVS